MRDAARHGMILVVAAAVLNAVGISLVDHDGASVAVVANVSASVVAVAAFGAIATIGRRRPEPFVFIVLIAVDAAIIGVGAYDPAMRLLAVGYLLLLPMVVALVIPWATSLHVTWLGSHAALVVGATWWVPGGSPLAADRFNLYTLLVVATTVSQLGHVTNLRARVASFSQIADIRALNRQAARDHLRLDRLNDQLERSAMTDELSGLKNRLGLTQDLRVIRSRVERYDQHYGLLMLDLDRFKAINDAGGHVEGDRVLRTTADAIVTTLRPGDSAYRYGGEEFAVVLLVGRPQEALAAAERIRGAIEGLALPNPGNLPYGFLTISIGVAMIGRGDLAEDDDHWVARADAALYRAKAGGRNRCLMDRIEIGPALPAEDDPAQAFSTDVGRPTR